VRTRASAAAGGSLAAAYGDPRPSNPCGRFSPLYNKHVGNTLKYSIHTRPSLGYTHAEASSAEVIDRTDIGVSCTGVMGVAERGTSGVWSSMYLLFYWHPTLSNQDDGVLEGIVFIRFHITTLSLIK